METSPDQELESDEKNASAPIEARESVQGVPPDHDELLYDLWKASGSHIREYASECLGTAFLLFCVVGIVSFLFGSSSPMLHLVPSTSARLFLTGFLLGLAGWLVALSPVGRLSGAHLNPALSLGFWVLRKIHLRDLVGYSVAQLIGSAIGTAIGIVLFHPLARQVNGAALHPGQGVPSAGAILAEVAGTFVLTFLIYTFLSYAPLRRWTPLMVTLLVCFLVGVDGGYSGAGLNPVRWFGPAALTSIWTYAGLYILAPLAGAILAAVACMMRPHPHAIPHTAKIVHDSTYPSIFKHDRVPSRPPRRS